MNILIENQCDCVRDYLYKSWPPSMQPFTENEWAQFFRGNLIFDYVEVVSYLFKHIFLTN